MKIAASVSNKLLSHSGGMIFWLGFMLLFGFSSRESMPHGIHSWAQSDRLAVAYSFYENDLNFLQPATYSLNSEGGRVGVEFPGIQYISAALAKITGIGHLPLIYRWVNFGLLIFSLLYLASGIKQQRIRWLTVWLFTLSPVLLYYGYGFLPDTAALAMCYFGIGAFLRSQNDMNRAAGFRLLSLLFFAVAALFKATSGIYLFIFGGYYCFSALLRKNYTNSLLYAGATALPAVLVGLFDYYYVIKTNKDLWSVIFMSKPKPVLNTQDVSDVFKGMGNWIPEYFGGLNGMVLLCAVIFLVYLLFSGKINRMLLIFSILSITGLLAVIYLFGKQFINHDYYFLSSFYPLVSGVLYLFMKRGARALPGIFKPNLFWLVVIAWSAIGVFNHAGSRGLDYYKTDHLEYHNNVAWLNNGDKTLSDFGVPEEAVIFVLYEDAPNLSLLYFGRKGMTFNFEELSRDRSPLFYWKERLQPDYYIVRKIWMQRLEEDLPDFTGQLETVGDFDEYVLMQWHHGY